MTAEHSTASEELARAVNGSVASRKKTQKKPGAHLLRSRWERDLDGRPAGEVEFALVQRFAVYWQVARPRVSVQVPISVSPLSTPWQVPVKPAKVTELPPTLPV